MHTLWGWNCCRSREPAIQILLLVRALERVDMRLDWSPCRGETDSRTLPTVFQCKSPPAVVDRQTWVHINTPVTHFVSAPQRRQGLDGYLSVLIVIRTMQVMLCREVGAIASI